MIAGIPNVRPENHMLYMDEECTAGNKSLTEYGPNSSTAKTQTTVMVGLAFRYPYSGKLEMLKVTPLSSPPELPDMKSPESPAHEQTVS